MFADSPSLFDEAIDNLNQNITGNRLECDDEEHYYKAQLGEIMNKQYQVTGKCGKGVFSTVVKAIDINTKRECAIKIMRSDEILIRAGERERYFLQILNENDKSDKRHVIRLLGSFEHRKHLCLVFELMERDLRETLKLYGKKVGLSLEAVKSYGKQIFLSLNHLQKHKIIHADIKPDNILTTNNSKSVKLCDFGSAFTVEDATITEYLQSRYYRAPEVILGCNYDTKIDIWGSGCTLYELYTGEFLFPGRDNNEMLKLIMQVKGKINNKMLRRGEYVPKYFDTNNNFLSNEVDPVTKQIYTKPLPIGDKPIKDLSVLLKIDEVKSSDEEKNLILLKDFLDKCLTLDPSKRMSSSEALQHPFLNPSAMEKFKK